jgi:hypothetical protein
VSQNLDARLLPDSVAIGRLSWCCSTRTIGDLCLISDEIVARLAYERALLQPWPYLGQERCRRCRRLLRCLLLVILPAAMTAADLCMGRGHCAEEEQQRHRQPTPRETRPCGVAWWSAWLNVIHPYRPTSFAPGSPSRVCFPEPQQHTMLVTSEVKVRHSRRDVIDTLARLHHRFLERTVARVLIPTLWQIGYTANEMCAFGRDQG